LVHQIAVLVECSGLLRQQLLHYERTMTKIAKGLEAGTPGMVAARGTGIPTQRRRVTEAIQEFEAARHRVRVVMFALAKEQGSSASDLARALGISRQLASRLAAEAEETHQ